jgi:hypothetical protein
MAGSAKLSTDNGIPVANLNPLRTENHPHRALLAAAVPLILY